jgi:hypothetical protein
VTYSTILFKGYKWTNSNVSMFLCISLTRSNTWMTINLYFSRYLPGIFTSINVYSKNGITIVTCARYTLQCFVCTQICHGISWLNMTNYTKYVELSCVLHVVCDNEIFLLFATRFRDFKWKRFRCYSAWYVFLL